MTEINPKFIFFKTDSSQSMFFFLYKYIFVFVVVVDKFISYRIQTWFLFDW